MNNMILTFGYGLISILFTVAVAVLCQSIKTGMKKILKGGQKHDDKQTAHRHSG